MKIVISGAGGFIGKHLCQHFISQGHVIIKIHKKHFKLDIHQFKELFRETDVLINLSGASVIRRWTDSNKKVIYSSRINTTQKIITAFKLLKYRPGLFISASATGIYNHNETKHTEESKDYSNENIGTLVKEWEESISEVNNLVDVRLIILRLGVVLAKKGGAFKKLSRPYHFGLGGRIGTGMQYFPVIHIDDLIGAIDFFIENKKTSGIYNLTIPHPITNNEFSKTLGKLMKRPSFMIIPKFLLKVFYGKGANILINGAYVLPNKLLSVNYRFKFSTIEDVITGLIKKKS